MLFVFTPIPGGNDPSWQYDIFSSGLVQPPTRYVLPSLKLTAKASVFRNHFRRNCHLPTINFSGDIPTSSHFPLASILVHFQGPRIETLQGIFVAPPYGDVIHERPELKIKPVYAGNTIDGRTPARKPVEVGWVFPMIFQVLYIPGGCLGFLPSTVSRWAYRKHLFMPWMKM